MRSTIEYFMRRAQAPEVSYKSKNVFNSPGYLYPWKNILGEFGKQGRTHIPIVGYGSLINLESAARTLPQSAIRHALPIVVIGFRRIFDYEIPSNVQRYKKYADSTARAALNVHRTGQIADLVNGLLFDLPLKEISALREREIDYDLLPAVCLHWSKPDQAPLDAFILRCQKRPIEPIEPNRDYYRVCRTGAEKMGKEFLKFWLTTTYLADDRTSAEEWEKLVFPELSK